VGQPLPEVVRVAYPQGQAQGELPVGRGASNPAANGRVERQILRRWLPDETEQRRVVGALVLNVFPVDFANDAQSRMHGPFANDAPYPEPVSVISIEPAARFTCTVTGPIMALTMAVAWTPTPFSRGRVDGSNGPASR